jgi:ubiquinone/menaquinone biosynthesis C-methylase UbiE
MLGDVTEERDQIKMAEDRSKDIERVRKRWDERAERYDEWYERFKGAVEHDVDWELLTGYLPENREAKILDAAGGTGRITLPLTRMGYTVTLCDISPAMLNVARQKLLREGVLDKVEIAECDVRKLRFADESFDFVLCWNGDGFEAVKELIRVTKKGGRISTYLTNRCRGAIDLFPEDPASALALIKSRSDYTYDDEGKYRAVSVEEARKLLETMGIRVLDTYAVCGWMDVLRIPPEVLESKKWDEGFFGQVTEMVFRLSTEPSVKGMSRHLVLYGEKPCTEPSRSKGTGR